MAFMQPDIYHGRYYEVQADHGSTWIVPVQVAGKVTTYGDLQDYVEGTIDHPDDPIEDVYSGWLARLSAPGYLDCTDWTAHSSEAEAETYLRETYDFEEETDEA